MDNLGYTVLGLLGTRLDDGFSERRWQRWRPTVALCQHEDLLVSRLVLLFDRQHSKLARQVRTDIATVSPETEVELHTLSIRDYWNFEEVYERLYEFGRAFDGWHDDRSKNLVHISTGSHVAQICTFLLTETRHFPARLVQTGLEDKRADPVGSYQIIDLDLSRYDRIATRHRRDRDEAEVFLKGGIATKNRAFNAQIAAIERVALASTDPILLTGPTGAGKSQLAGRIAELRRHRQKLTGPFVEVNCATLRGDQAQSALFGHEKGAYTGAASKREGLLRTAHGGMLFLDEIGELGADEQAMLLRALEAKRFLPVGADREVESDFQLIAGTNRDLHAAVTTGGFREDLLARINLWTFELPGLCQRREDIEPNLDFELDQFRERSGQNVTFRADARTRYLEFATDVEARWPGNFRDLNASVTRMCTLAHDGSITRQDVRDELARLQRAWQRPAAVTDQDDLLRKLLGTGRVEELDLFDRAQLATVATVCRESRTLSEAGRRLFAASRTRRKSANDADRLRKYLARFELTFRDLAP
ncbi:MAG: RNA repair transcriptional activator RtcR [bacterium]|nr:RNA repair transcriptional activator RtcR [bacterium]